MTERLALRRTGDDIAVLREVPIPLEAQMQKAFVDHPEALPAADLNLGPLTSIGWEVNFGAGPIDQLAVDTRGQLVIVEFKRGTENPDVRRVIAQLLDYGSSLWRTSLNDLQDICRNNGSCTLLGNTQTIADHVATPPSEALDLEAFERNLEACLAAGTFVFLYVVRDLDKATLRVLSYLSEGAGLRFYAVEVDHFASDDQSSILVPRVAYIPANVAAGEAPVPPPDPSVTELCNRIEELAAQAGVHGFKSRAGRRWVAGGQPILGLYRTATGLMFWLPEITIAASHESTQGIRERLQALFPEAVLAPMYPAFEPSAYLAQWDHGGADVVLQLFSAVASAEPAVAEPGPRRAVGLI